jgi:1,4-dihydroxy-6-naphthoate synthase
MKLTLGFSPCPNDTFIFDALVNNNINTKGLEFEVHLEDVQTLNKWALQGKLDFSKISYGVLPLILENYLLLRSGGAIGNGVGPLLISKQKVGDVSSYIKNSTVAIPGENTTAHMLFSLAFPAAYKKEFLVFNQIEEAVLSGKVDAGVIIHENRFTYQQKGLVKLIDLGKYWEEETGLPIPLGGIVARRKLEKSVVKRVDELIKASIEIAFSNYPRLPAYTQQHSQEMEEDVMRKHIDLYVNEYSLDVAEKGKAAVEKLLDIAGCKLHTNLFAA